jgi:hypothetical protein
MTQTRAEPHSKRTSHPKLLLGASAALLRIRSTDDAIRTKHALADAISRRRLRSPTSGVADSGVITGNRAELD